MKYNFKEAQLGDDFCLDRVGEMKKRLNPSGFFTIVGMPGVGISFFIRFLATRKFAHFIYLDIASLAAPTKHEFYIALLKELGVVKFPKGEQEMLELGKKRIKELASKEHVVFLFNRFDEMGNSIDKSFLGSLRTLRHGIADKVSLIFVSHKPISDISEGALSGGNLDMFSNVYYFKPYSEGDLYKLFSLHAPEFVEDKKQFSEVYRLSGGHYELAKLIYKSEKNKSVVNKFIQFSLKKIYSSVSYIDKKTLQKIVFGKNVKQVGEGMVDLGIIKDNTVFSPLLAEYIRTSTAIKLPVKEAKLLQLLKKRLDKVVLKEEIFKALWSEDDEEYGSDWALNSLIYRLRKNPIFAAKGYVIESYKKVGYMLVKE